MRQGERPLGQLMVKSNEPRIYSEAELEAIQLLSTMAAQALARARRQAEERAEHARVAAILELRQASSSLRLERIPSDRPYKMPAAIDRG